MEFVNYNTEDNPTDVGVYACRVPDDVYAHLYADVFLMWMNGAWNRLKSDQKYRGKVIGWIGPLQRKMDVWK